MNKSAIKTFAVEARKKLIASVKDKAGMLGITKDKISEPAPKGADFETYSNLFGRQTTLTGSEITKRANFVANIKVKGYDTVMEEVAYTWFNRLIAVRFMEVNDYLPARVRVLSSETKGKLEPDIITQAPNVDLNFTPDEIEQIIKLKQDNKLDELFRLLFIRQCNALNAILPELFERTDNEHDYSEMLLNISYINDDGIVRSLVDGIDEADFTEAVEIIGWLYQYYNTELKNETFALLKKNVKITKERIPAATQLFTPDWIVRYMVENSLGRLWIEHLQASSDNVFSLDNFDLSNFTLNTQTNAQIISDLKTNWKYYLDEAEQEADVQAQLETIRAEYRALKPEDIKVIDPCMGSGHILVYAFEVLMDIYKSCGYTEKDAARLILEKNLYGFDIDHRAYELAYFALLMKARSYSRRILNEGVNLNISLSYALDPQHYAKDVANHVIDSTKLDYDKKQLKADIDYLLEMNQNVTEYGSIVDVKPLDFDNLETAIKALIDDGRIDDFKNLLPLVKQARILAGKYDVVVTNPPYMGSSGMNAKLSEYVQKNYPNSKSDLFAVFIETGLRMAKPSGYNCMVTMQSWMFLSSFESMRKKVITTKTISNLMHMENMVMGIAFGTAVTTVRNCKIKRFKGTYNQIKFSDIDNDNKPNEFPVKENRFAQVSTENFSKIPGMPISYWVSEKVFDLYCHKKIIDISKPCKGIDTGNNSIFLRFWFEINHENQFVPNGRKLSEADFIYKWFPYNKGGAFRRWYGNNEYLLNWENNGGTLKSFKGSNLRNKDYYFHEGITWSTVTSGSSSLRYFTNGYLFDNGGCCLFANVNLNYINGLLNSKVSQVLLKISPTLNYQPGDIGRIPIIISDSQKSHIDELVSQNIVISKTDWDNFETSWDFTTHPLLKFGVSMYSGLGDSTNHPVSEIGIHETNFIYEKNVPTNARIETSFKMWQQFTESQFATLKANEEELNRIFIEIYGLQDELTPEVEDKDVTIRKADLGRDIRSFVSYAVGCMFGRYSIYKDGLVYAGGDNSSLLIPNSSFQIDKDNIIPITDAEYFNDDMVAKFVEFVKLVYGEKTLEGNLDFIANALGNRGDTSREVIRSYFLRDFYKDHVKIYQKRPIYWLFDSSGSASKGSGEDGFKALIYMHRYDEDTVGRVRTDYLHKTQAAIEGAIANADNLIGSTASASDKAKAMKAKEKLIKQLAETRLYDQAIAHVAHQRIAIDLDDGVVVNYAKFQGVEVANEGKKTVTIDLLGKI